MSQRLRALTAVALATATGCWLTANLDGLSVDGARDGGGAEGGATPCAACAESGVAEAGVAEAGVAEAGGPTPTTVHCPSSPTPTSCAFATEVCCGVPTANAFRRSYECRAPSACEAPAVSLPCMSAADCEAQGHPSTVCCATLDTSSLLQSVSCIAPAGCPPNKANDLTLTQILCDPTAPICANGLSCQADPTHANIGLFYCFMP